MNINIKNAVSDAKNIALAVKRTFIWTKVEPFDTDVKPERKCIVDGEVWCQPIVDIVDLAKVAWYVTKTWVKHTLIAGSWFAVGATIGAATVEGITLFQIFELVGLVMMLPEVWMFVSALGVFGVVAEMIVLFEMHRQAENLVKAFGTA